tara:strand:+ start:28056 stop:29129 length:1074 start_codon:yes stop_codon:yes gene_type:complete
MTDQPAELPHIASYKPCYMELEQGKSYMWCSCGLSKNQPFCDQSHRGTNFKPVQYVAKEVGEEVLFCNCKQSQDKPFCDGTHNNLKDRYEEDDPNSESNLKVPLVATGPDGRALLDAGCYVAQVDKIELASFGNLDFGTLISRETGALHQSLFYVEVAPGRSPIMSFGDRHVIVLATEGCVTACISGRNFSLDTYSGLYLRPQEAFSIDNPESTHAKLFVSVCPLSVEPELLGEMPDNFDDRYPVRIVNIDRDNRQAMGDRFFQVLVDKRIGSTVATQFIGEVPLSKAAMHRHLYEESLVVLRGRGYMWTESGKAPVATGDVIFLPRKQIHSLECTDPQGMLLAGVIYPGDNPSINY